MNYIFLPIKMFHGVSLPVQLTASQSALCLLSPKWTKWPAEWEMTGDARSKFCTEARLHKTLGHQLKERPLLSTTKSEIMAPLRFLDCTPRIYSTFQRACKTWECVESHAEDLSLHGFAMKVSRLISLQTLLFPSWSTHFPYGEKLSSESDSNLVY